MGYVIVAILFGGFIIWILYLITKQSAREKEAREKQAVESELKVRINRETTTTSHEEETLSYNKEAPAAAHTAKQISSDAAYAAKNGLWVCAYCETLNANSARRCCACGKENKRL